VAGLPDAHAHRRQPVRPGGGLRNGARVRLGPAPLLPARREGLPRVPARRERGRALVRARRHAPRQARRLPHPQVAPEEWHPAWPARPGGRGPHPLELPRQGSGLPQRRRGRATTLASTPSTPSPETVPSRSSARPS
jgi:hypothetical protein